MTWKGSFIFGIGVLTYQVLTDVPEDLKGLLPAPEQIARLLNEIEFE